MNCRSSWLLVALLCFAPLAGQSQTPANTQGNAAVSASAKEPASGFRDRYPRYRLEVGDTFEIGFQFTPEFNQTVTVQPDGFVELKEVGDLHVQGATTDEVKASIAKAYHAVLHNPEVSVLLKDFDKPSIVVGGSVRNPGKFELRGNTTLVEAIQYAGGFTDESKHSNVYLYRQDESGALTEVKRINVKQMLASGNLSEDLTLKPGDVVFVPQNTFSKLKALVVPRPTMGVTARTR